MTTMSLHDQHTHPFLWRNDDANNSIQTLVMTAVSFGDRPAGTIAILALKKLALMFDKEYPDACKVIGESTYVDDIIDSRSSHESVQTNIDNIETVHSFKVKGWTISGVNNTEVDVNHKYERVLGVVWDPVRDILCFNTEIKDFSDDGKIGECEFTKRIAFSMINRIYDPLGLISPVTVKGKMLLRELTSIEPRLDWDSPIPSLYQIGWKRFNDDLKELPNLSFPRCTKPLDAIGNPIIVTFSDASEKIFGACSYIRWNISDGKFISFLLMSKNRVAPIRTLSIVRLELSAAVIATRIRRFIMDNCRLTIKRFIHIVDSEIVRSMIQKEAYRFNTIVGTRIGEIQTNSKPEEWFWLKGEENIADIITRGGNCSHLGPGSDWQCGPYFLSRSIEEWPIQNSSIAEDLPERNKVNFSVTSRIEETSIIDVEQTSIIDIEQTSIIDIEQTSIIDIEQTSIIDIEQTSIIDIEQTSIIDIEQTSIIDIEQTSIIDIEQTSIIDIEQTSIIDIEQTSIIDIEQTSIIDIEQTSIIDIEQTSIIDIEQTSIIDIEQTSIIDIEQTSIIDIEQTSIIDIEQTSIIDIEQTSIIDIEQTSIIDIEQTSIIDIEQTSIIDIERFSNYLRLLDVTGRLLTLRRNDNSMMGKKPSFKLIGSPVTVKKLNEAEIFWVKEAQKEIKDDLLLGTRGSGPYRRLTPRIDDNGFFVIGGRTERWVNISYNKAELPILPKVHRLSLLYARNVHQLCHLGVDADIAKIRSVFWIIGLQAIVKSIRNQCVTCRKKYIKNIRAENG